jgi:hypothetical protein
MGIRSIRRALDKLKDIPKEITKIPDKLKNIFKGLLDEAINSIKRVMLNIVKSVSKPFANMFRGLFQFLEMIKKFFMNLIKKIVSGFTYIFFYIKCGLKLMKNFYKCAIFYFLDIFKYVFIYLPTMAFMYAVKWKGKWKRETKPALDKNLQWPNGIRNDCYRCKNKKGKKFNLGDQIKKLFEQEGVDDSEFNFLFFMLVAFGAAGMCYTFWHNFMRDKF